MDLLRLYGNFQDVDGQGRVELGSSPEAWSGRRIDDLLREGLHVLIFDGHWEAECVLEFDGEYWYARHVMETDHDKSESEPEKGKPRP